MTQALKHGPNQDELTWASAWQIRDCIRAGRWSARQVTDHFLARIERLEPEIHAFRTLDAEGARRQADCLDGRIQKGESLGALAGVPVSVKEHLAVEGLPYWPLFAEAVPRASRDSIAVERLRDADAVIFGTTIMPGMGNLGAGEPGDFKGHPRNPWNLGRVPGASTAGGAGSVAAAMTPISIASDAAGSTRLPASFSGIIGFHPSFGRVPYVDYHAPIRPDEVTVGPMARDVRDIATIMEVLAGPDGRDMSAIGSPPPDYLQEVDAGVEGLSFGWTDDFGYGGLYAVDETPDVIAAARNAAQQFQALGATVETVDEFWEDYFPAFRATVAAYGHPIKAAAYQSVLSVEGYAAGLDIQRRNWERFRRVFSRHDLLLSPTVQMVAPTLEDWDAVWAAADRFPHGNYMPSYAANTHMFSIFGWPAISIPCGFVDGMPVGLQVIGKPEREAMILRAASAFLRAFPWTGQAPAAE